MSELFTIDSYNDRLDKLAVMLQEENVTPTPHIQNCIICNKPLIDFITEAFIIVDDNGNSIPLCNTCIEAAKNINLNTDVFILYGRISAIPARKLKDKLNEMSITIKSGRSTRLEKLLEKPNKIGTIIRYGCTAIPEIDSNDKFTILNKAECIEKNTDKLKSLEILRDANVRVIPFSENPSDLQFPLYGRKCNHFGGRDINYITNEDALINDESDFYTQEINATAEYRVHIANNSAFLVQKKIPGPNAILTNPIRRNRRYGFVTHTITNSPCSLLKALAIKATQALELDFSAVDILKDENNNHYVLEVNTAPSLMDERLDSYANEIITMINK